MGVSVDDGVSVGVGVAVGVLVGDGVGVATVTVKTPPPSASPAGERSTIFPVFALYGTVVFSDVGDITV